MGLAERAPEVRRRFGLPPGERVYVVIDEGDAAQIDHGAPPCSAPG
jgi:hypothetical protein